MLALTIARFQAAPERVTDILGLQPTLVARKGAVNPKSGRPYGANSWEFDVHPNRLTSGVEQEAALAAIVDLLRGRERQFARLREEVRPQLVTIYGELYVRPDEPCGVWIDPQHMRVLAECEIAWGLELFADQ